MSVDTIPSHLLGLRACLLCSLVKSTEQFELDGCENCEYILGMKNNRDNVYNHTSASFDGFIALTSPEESWVGKWMRINRFQAGVYAISVSGKLPPDIIRELKAHGEAYKSRDRSTT